MASLKGLGRYYTKNQQKDYGGEPKKSPRPSATRPTSFNSSISRPTSAGERGRSYNRSVQSSGRTRPSDVDIKSRSHTRSPPKDTNRDPDGFLAGRSIQGRHGSSFQAKSFVPNSSYSNPVGDPSKVPSKRPSQGTQGSTKQLRDSTFGDPRKFNLRKRTDSQGRPSYMDPKSKPIDKGRIAFDRGQPKPSKNALFATALDDPSRQMSGAYSQLTMDERIRAFSLLRKHGLFPVALKLDKLPKPIDEEKGVAPSQQILDETSVFEVVKAAVDMTPIGGGKDIDIDVPPGAVGAVGQPAKRAAQPSLDQSEGDIKFAPVGKVPARGIVPICDEYRPCVKAEPCDVKPQPQDLSKILSPSQMEAHNYLSKKKVFEFFQFMICHLLAEQPEDPVAFLGNLLDRCMMYRSGFADPPLLFTKKHVQSVYRAMDPDDRGHISRKQYETGMKTMSITEYSTDPETDEFGNISKEFFINEAVDRLTDNLTDMLKVGEVEPWSFLDKWFIPTAKIKTEQDLERENAENHPAPPLPSAPSPPTGRRVAPTGKRPLSTVGAQRPSVDSQPLGLSTGRASVIGHPSFAASLRRDSEEHQSHMHDGPEHD